MKTKITATVCLESALWVAIFERVHDNKLSAARVIFGKEPTDPELYQWLMENYDQLNFSSPQDFTLQVRRKNPKRMLREVKREMAKSATSSRKESVAQEALRLEIEQRKKIKRSVSKDEKQAELDRRFLQKQQQKKEKKRGK